MYSESTTGLLTHQCWEGSTELLLIATLWLPFASSQLNSIAPPQTFGTQGKADVPVIRLI